MIKTEYTRPKMNKVEQHEHRGVQSIVNKKVK